jgi:hypothetical protein
MLKDGNTVRFVLNTFYITPEIALKIFMVIK